jgi:hypothetical protein
MPLSVLTCQLGLDCNDVASLWDSPGIMSHTISYCLKHVVPDLLFFVVLDCLFNNPAGFILLVLTSPQPLWIALVYLVKWHVPGLGGSFCDILLVGAYVCKHAAFLSIQSRMFYMLKLYRTKISKPAMTQRKTQWERWYVFILLDICAAFVMTVTVTVITAAAV